MSIHDSKRRAILGRAITFGMALAALPLIAACRDEGDGAMSESDKPGPGEEPAESQETPAGNSTNATGSGGERSKLTKSQAQYQEQPNGNEQCSNCTHFIAESGSCALVQGSIAPDAWCRLWVKAS